MQDEDRGFHPNSRYDRRALRKHGDYSGPGVGEESAEGDAYVAGCLGMFGGGRDRPLPDAGQDADHAPDMAAGLSSGLNMRRPT